MKFLASLLIMAAALPGQNTPANDGTDVNAANGVLDDYFLVLIRPDPSRKPIEKAEGQRIQAAHMANIHKMAADGTLVAAGPMQGDPPIAGIFIFKTTSLEEARGIAAQDPTVTEKRNTVDVFAWRGPPGIGAEYREWRKQNPDAKEEMTSYQFCLLRKGTASSREETAKILGGHRQFIGRMRSEGKLGLAGHIDGGGDILGLFVFKTESREEAERLANEDPAISSGLLRTEFHRWYCAKRVLPR